jgi:carbonic anhydrase
MDARLSVEQMLGLKAGDAHIIRNAGGIVTEDAMRSLIISHHLLGTEEVLIINHTGCGMLMLQDEQFRATSRASTGQTAAVPADFHAFHDLRANVKQQVETVKAHPWLPKSMPVRGFIYDVKSGKLTEV